jgi:predicted amidohydrolase
MSRKNTLNLTLVQTTLFWEDRDKNLGQFDKILSGIKGTDLVVLPEMFTTGFTMNAKNMAENMNGTSVQWMKDRAKKLKAALCGSLIIEEKKKYYNRFVWVMPNGEVFTYDKRHLFSPADENKYFTAGSEKIMINYKGWNIVPLVCFDLRFPVWSRNVNAEADLMIYVANWPSPRNNAWQQLLIARAIENQCYVAGANRVGKDGKGMEYTGSSAVIDYLGHEVLKGPDKKSWVKSVSIDKKPLDEFRKKFPVWKDADEFKVIL